MLFTTGTGEVTVFKNKWGRYSIGLSKSSLKEDGSKEYINAFMPASFKKGVELEDKTKINVTNSFLTFDKFINKEGKDVTQFKMFITEFTPVEGQTTPVKKETTTETFGAVDEDDLPF